MKLVLPNNIFTRLLAQAMPPELRLGISYSESALIAKSLTEGNAQIALMPSMDLLRHQDLFVSYALGMSFDGSISNSYFYFAEGTKHIDSLTLSGDISSVEAVLARIAIHEMYDENINVAISTQHNADSSKNLLLTGDANFEDGQFSKGLDFAEEISEITGLPFVHYVFASKDETLLKNFSSQLEGIEQSVYGLVEAEGWQSGFPELSTAALRENMQHVIYEFDDSDIQGLQQMIQLVYFHGIIQDIFDIKFCH